MSDLSDFEIVKKLGSGTFSVVYKVLRYSDGEQYAMKKVLLGSLSQKDRVNSLNEVRILASINCPQVIGYREAFLKGDILYIVLEYAGGGDLSQKIEHIKRKGIGYSMDEAVIWCYLTDILKGLQVLHQNNIYHRDIKCANLFLSCDHKKIKLGDLNVAKVCKNSMAQTQAGTPYYASPEVWKDEPYDGKCDVWSLGCVAYEMAQLQPPFLANDLKSLSRKIVKGQYEPIHSRYSKELSNFIASCLSVDVSKRATIDQLLQLDPFRRRMDSFVSKNNSFHQMLSTIFIPKNLKEISLPKARYITDENNKRPSSRSIRNKSNNNMSNNNISQSPDIVNNSKTKLIPILKRSISQNQSQLKENISPQQNLYQLQPPKCSPRLGKHLSSPNRKLLHMMNPETQLPPINNIRTRKL